MEAWRPDHEPAPTVTLIVATYGDSTWECLGADTARRAAIQLDRFDRVIHLHEPDHDLAWTRNAAAVYADTGWLCFVDADDDLDPGYVAAMRPHLQAGRLLAPAAQMVTDGARGPLEHYYDRDIRHLNPCIIGTLVERSLFLAVGGFFDEPIYEDWSLFLRCWRAGAVVHPVPEAVYRVRLRPGSRNDQPQSVKHDWYWRIRKAYA